MVPDVPVVQDQLVATITPPEPRRWSPAAPPVSGNPCSVG